ncbi:MAG: hypothetical protein AYK19_15380 [Theionarchaea archaeon DG-70-1]|nr:MAG: hypothetical protein AYK19_15380 [Theionarchaea archaeon DG-70-1]
MNQEVLSTEYLTTSANFPLWKNSYLNLLLYIFIDIRTKYLENDDNIKAFGVFWLHIRNRVSIFHHIQDLSQKTKRA